MFNCYVKAQASPLLPILEFTELDGQVETEDIDSQFTYELMNEFDYQEAGAGTLVVPLGSIATLKGYCIKPISGTVEVRLDGEGAGHECEAGGLFLATKTTASAMSLAHLGDCTGKILLFGNPV